MGTFHSHFGTVEEAVKQLNKTAIPKDKNGRRRLPVTVVRRKLKDESGYCLLMDKTKTKPKRFQVVICKTLQENAAVLILVHEWAHALAWFKEGSNHGPRWGKLYARCWRLLTEENEDWD